MKRKPRVKRSPAFAKMQALRELYNDSESLDILTERENALRIAIEQANVPNLPVIALIVEDCDKELERINDTLCTNEKLNEVQRSKLFASKTAFEFLRDRLQAKHANEVINSVERYVDERYNENFPEK